MNTNLYHGLDTLDNREFEAGDYSCAMQLRYNGWLLTSSRRYAARQKRVVTEWSVDMNDMFDALAPLGDQPAARAALERAAQLLGVELRLNDKRPLKIAINALVFGVKGNNLIPRITAALLAAGWKGMHWTDRNGDVVCVVVNRNCLKASNNV